MFQNFFFKALAAPTIIFQLAFGVAFFDCAPSFAQDIPSQGTSSNPPFAPPPDLLTPSGEDTDLSVQENVSQVKEAIEGKRSESALDQFDLLPQKVYNVIPDKFSDTIQTLLSDDPTEKRFQQINPDKIDGSALSLLNDKGQIISNSRSGAVFNGVSQNLKIAFQNYLLNEFEIPVRAAAFFGKYLVFIKDNTSDVSFVDLDYFRPALGRTSLAVFRIPIETAVPISKLSVVDGTLYADDTPITRGVFEFYSDVQKTTFNVTAGLVDPDAVGDTQILADSLHEYFNKALDLRSEQLAQEMENANASNAAFARFSATLDPKKRIESFESQKFIEDTAVSMTNNFKAQRKLMARIGYLWAQMSIPRPLAAPKIVQALSLVATGLDPRSQNRSSDLKEGLLQLANHRGVQMGAAVVTGAALGTIYPHEMAQFFYGSLDITKTVMELSLGKARAIAS